MCQSTWVTLQNCTVDLWFYDNVCWSLVTTMFRQHWSVLPLDTSHFSSHQAEKLLPWHPAADWQPLSVGSHTHVCYILTNDMSSGSKGMTQRHCWVWMVCEWGGGKKGENVLELRASKSLEELLTASWHLLDTGSISAVLLCEVILTLKIRLIIHPWCLRTYCKQVSVKVLTQNVLCRGTTSLCLSTLSDSSSQHQAAPPTLEKN